MINGVNAKNGPAYSLQPCSVKNQKQSLSTIGNKEKFIIGILDNVIGNKEKKISNGMLNFIGLVNSKILLNFS